MLSKAEIQERLNDHDDRVIEGGAEIRLLGSFKTGKHNIDADFVIFVVICNGHKTMFDETQEEQALSQYIQSR